MRVCTVCRHDSRELVHERLIAGVSFRAIAAEFGLSKSAVERHAGQHVAELLAKDGESRKVLEAGRLVDRVEELHRVAGEILAEARADGDDKTALRALTRLERQVALAGRILGELRDVQVLEVASSVEWQGIRGELLKALLPYADARTAVVEALRRFEA